MPLVVCRKLAFCVHLARHQDHWLLLALYALLEASLMELGQVVQCVPVELIALQVHQLVRRAALVSFPARAALCAKVVLLDSCQAHTDNAYEP